MKKAFYNLRNSRLAVTVFLVALLAGCGGGGGGGGSSEDTAARVNLSVSPGSIDTGDRTTVTVLIEEVNEDGAAIKIRFPVGLRYILGSSELEVDGSFIETAPTSNVSDTKYGYLVYYVQQGTIGDGSGTLTFKLLGTKAITAGQVEVDADLDDSAIDNQDEFQVATPNFAAESGDGIVVKG